MEIEEVCKIGFYSVISLLSLGCGSLLEVVRVVEFGYDSVKFVEVSSKVSVGILLRNRLQIVIQLGYLN